MTIPTIAFFNNKGGVGKTSLVYHVAWMFSHLRVATLACDLDPQGNLSAAFLDDDRLEQLWLQQDTSDTAFGAVSPLKKGIGDVSIPSPEAIDRNLHLLVGDIALSSFEDDLSQEWPKCLDGNERSFRVISAFWRIMQGAALKVDAKVILIDLGPNLGAINRSALIASDFVVIPLGPDLFSLQGLQNLGPSLRSWRKEWTDRLTRKPVDLGIALPAGTMLPLGYIIMQHSVRKDRPVKSYDKWIARVPTVYRERVLDQKVLQAPPVDSDSNCIALVKHYRSLMPMAQEARKPVFALRGADGALGAHTYAVQEAFGHFRTLSTSILERARLSEIIGAHV